MKIRMLRTQYGSPDGVSVLLYEIGVEYDLSATERSRDLAAVFLREGWAESAAAKPVEEKMLPRIENKAIETAPEDKGAGRKRKG